MKIGVILVAVVAVLTNFSCTPVPITPDLHALGGFPISVGSRWTYATYDSLSHERDTVTVTVTGMTSTPAGDTTYQCLYQHLAFADTGYTSISGDTVVFATDQAPPVNLIFPLTIGITWKYQSVYDVSIVAVNADSVPAGSFDQTIEVEEVSRLPNDESRYDYWIAQGVGVVQFYDATFVTVDNRRRKTMWQLLSYSLAN